MKLINRLLIAAALLGTGSLALADNDNRGHDRRGQQHGQRDHRPDRGQVERRHADYRRDYRRDYSRHDRHDDRRDDRRHDYRHDYRGHGYRPAPPRYQHMRWVRGHRYHGPSYVVRDYGYYRLRPPPYGYHWVRADNDFLLVAITTGIILDLALR